MRNAVSILTYTSTIKDRSRWPLAETADTLLLLFSLSTNCVSSAIMAQERCKMSCVSQTMRCSLTCFSLRRTNAPSARPVSSASTRWTVEIKVYLFNHASILSVTAAGLNVWKKGTGRTVCFAHRAIPHQILVLTSEPKNSLVQQMKLRRLTHPN
jgi:hypothetical protein